VLSFFQTRTDTEACFFSVESRAADIGEFHLRGEISDEQLRRFDVYLASFRLEKLVIRLSTSGSSDA
jgi:hypothetical protein